MPTKRIELRIFAAAPTEVWDDKMHVREVVEELNSIHGANAEVVLRYVAWETDVHPSVGRDAQDVINEQIGDHYDIFIGLMWSRFGQPTLRFGSGTEEECQRALQRAKTDPESVSILFYFKDAAIPPSKIDVQQLSAVSRFKQSLSLNGVLFDTYQAGEELKLKLRKHLAAVSREWIKRVSQPSVPIAGKSPVSEPQAHASGDEEGDFGFLDYIEKGMTCFQHCAAAANRIGKIMNARSVNVPLKAEKLTSAMRLPPARRLSAARRILKSIAADMDAMSVVFEEQTEIVAVNFNAGFAAFEISSKMLTSIEGADTSELAELLQVAETFKATLLSSEQSFTTLQATIIGLPQIDQSTNKAGKRLSRAVANYIETLSRGRATLISFHQTLGTQLMRLADRSPFEESATSAK